MANQFPRFLLCVSACVLLSACGSASVSDIDVETTSAVVPISPPNGVAETVLQEVADLICPISPSQEDNRDLYLDFFTTDTSYGFNCSPAIGHTTSVSLQWYSTQNEAQTAFENGHQESTVEEFHGFPLSMWDKDDPSFPGGRKEVRVWLWHTQHWLIKISAFDDTHFLIAPDPETVSEAVYQIGMEHKLFADDDQ